MKKLFQYIDKRITDPSRSFEERVYTVLTIIAVLGVFVALIGDIIERENIVEILLLAGTEIMVPLALILSVRAKNVRLSTHLIVIGLVFIVLPTVFFFGGGVEGGGVLWIIFSYLYIGLVLSGAWRTVMLILLTIFSIAEYAIAYLYPQLVHPHSRLIFYIDSLVSIIMVGLVCFVMVQYQNRMFRIERKKAQEETKRAEELNRSQNRFFSSMSHEIRTPIHTILGLNEIILRQDNASEEIVKDARNIQGAGKMLLALVNDILDVSKIEAGKMEIVPVDYSVGDLVSEIVNMIWLKTQEKGLEFHVDIDPSTPSMLFGDEVRIKQIMINLLNNAAKYTTEGSITLHMECEDASEGNVLLKVTVSDTGMGIKKESLPHLFDAFQRVDEEKNRLIDGTGLGLSIVKQLVDLMGGSISVNSVYTQGSTFVLTLPQGVVGGNTIGDLNIASKETEKTVQFSHRFRAPEAHILIVDDNEMNLEVETKLLLGTDIAIDTAISGRDALERTLRKKYDVILMDHLMPEMDGIECMTQIRRQTGGLNREIPVIVLTANAGGENTELYHASGFDGYLLKPVSGMQLEEMLLKMLPQEKVILGASGELTHQEMNTTRGYSRKTPVLITTGTMSDLPDALTRELELDMVPFIIYTEHGAFWDGVETVSDELVRYIRESGRNVETGPPSVDAFLAFFTEKLKKAHHVIHISICSGISEEYNNAMEAAKTFENVTVIDSGLLSSATGLLAMLAYKMAQENASAEWIVRELETMKKQIHCSFVLADTGFMTKHGFISERVNMILKTLWLRPSLQLKRNKLAIGKIFMGSRKKCYEKYIRYALPLNAHPDKDILFITYVDVAEEDLLWIEREVKKRFAFERIIFQKASAAIASNCGSGTFGLLYMDKGKRSYRLGTLVPPDLEGSEETEEFENGEPFLEAAASGMKEEQRGQSQENAASEDHPDGIDWEEGIKNSGSNEAYQSVLQIFYDSIEEKADEIDAYYREHDLKNYTIKVHAMKSSARLIGAMKLSEDAQKMEDAGKAEDLDYIVNHHERLLSDYRNYLQILKERCAKNGEDKRSKPLADPDLMDGFYETLAEAAEQMNAELLEQAFSEMDDYTIPKDEASVFTALKQAADRYDYEGINGILQDKKGSA